MSPYVVSATWTYSNTLVSTMCVHSSADYVASPCVVSPTDVVLSVYVVLTSVWVGPSGRHYIRRHTTYVKRYRICTYIKRDVCMSKETLQGDLCISVAVAVCCRVLQCVAMCCSALPMYIKRDECLTYVWVGLSIRYLLTYVVFSCFQNFSWRVHLYFL